MGKIKETWSKCSLFAKVLTIAAPIILAVDVLTVVLLIFEVLPTDMLRGIGKTSMALLWGLIGPVWWDTHKLFSISCFGISLVSILHAVLLFLR